MWVRLNGVGLLVKDGHIDVGSVHDLMRQTILTQWEKWRDIIIRIREEYNMVGFCEGFEYLANEMVKEIERRGHSADVPKSFARYVPKAHTLFFTSLLTLTSSDILYGECLSDHS
jgi:hypothetical protein